MTDSRNSNRTPLFIMAVLGVGVLILLGVFVFASDEDASSLPAERAETDSAVPPTGAGTNPDGVADELDEGLLNETATDDFIDSSAASSATDTVTTDNPQEATSAEGLEPPVGEGNVDRMLPETDGN